MPRIEKVKKAACSPEFVTSQKIILITQIERPYEHLQHLRKSVKVHPHGNLCGGKLDTRNVEMLIAE